MCCAHFIVQVGTPFRLSLNLALGGMNQPRLIFTLKGSQHYVAGASVSSSELASISSTTVALNFEGADIDDEDLLKLPPLPLLRCLDLDSTKITDTSISVVSRFPALEELWLECTAITDNGLEPLKSCASLKFVSLAYTAVTPSGIASLESSISGIEIEK